MKSVGEENSESVNIEANLTISINLLAYISVLCMISECNGKRGEILANDCLRETYSGCEIQISLLVFHLLSNLQTLVGLR